MERLLHVARRPAASPAQVPYKILSKEDLQKQRRKAIEEVTSVLDIPEDAAVRVLRKYKW